MSCKRRKPEAKAACGNSGHLSRTVCSQRLTQGRETLGETVGRSSRGTDPGTIQYAAGVLCDPAVFIPALENFVLDGILVNGSSFFQTVIFYSLLF